MTNPTNTLAMPGTEETGNRVHAVALVLLIRGWIWRNAKFSSGSVTQCVTLQSHADPDQPGAQLVKMAISSGFSDNILSMGIFTRINTSMEILRKMNMSMEILRKINISMGILSKKLTCIDRICSHLSHYTDHRTEI